MTGCRQSLRRRIPTLGGLAVLLAIVACAPVSVDRVDLGAAYADLNRTALSSNQLSDLTRIVLRRNALLELVLAISGRDDRRPALGDDQRRHGMAGLIRVV